MSITLFPDQEYLVQEALKLTNNAKKHTNVLITSPSGSGKTFIIAELIHRLLKLGFKQEEILVISPTYEISEQIYDRINLALDTFKHNVLILGSVLTSRLDDDEETKLPIKIIIVDEAHHTEAKTYKKTIAKFPSAIVFGFTATPMRNDEKELSDTYDHMLSGLSISELIKAKRLSDYKYILPKTEDMPIVSKYLNLDSTVFASQHKKNKLERKIYSSIVDTWIEHAHDRQTILFASSIEESKLIADEFKMFGVKAEHVDGSVMDMEERSHIIERFRKGKIQVLCNYGLVSEGFDVPEASCVVLARPTNSVILHLQQCFRAMRVGKDFNQKAIIIDHVNNIARFGDLKINRGWSLTMDEAQKALAKTGKDTRSKKKAKNYDVDYLSITDAEMIALANVTSPFFDEAVEKALKLPKESEIDKINGFREFAKIQKKYHIQSPKGAPSWACMMAIHFGYATDNMIEAVAS